MVHQRSWQKNRFVTTSEERLHPLQNHQPPASHHKEQAQQRAGGLGGEKPQLWEGQRASSQEEGNATHSLAEVLIRAFQPKKHPARKGKFEQYCS